MNEKHSPVMEAAECAMEHIENNPGVDFRFRLHLVTETCPSYIENFTAANAPAVQLCRLMQKGLSDNPFVRKDELTASFNVVVETAQQRNFATERDDMLTIRSAKTISVLKPLTFRR